MGVSWIPPAALDHSPKHPRSQGWLFPCHLAAVGIAVPFPKPAVPSCLHSRIRTLSQHSHCFFSCSGLIPRLLGDILSLWLCNMLAYLINTYALENGVSTMTEMKSYSQAVTGVSTATGRKWILSLGSGVFPEFCRCRGGDGARLGSAGSGTGQGVLHGGHV